MKRHLAPSLFALSLCALLGGARAAEAQSADAIVPPVIDSVAVPAPGAIVPGTPSVMPADFRPIARSTSPILTNDATLAGDVALAPDYASIFGRDWKMPTSRTLMIGGTVAAILGLTVVGGDAGAIIAMAGGGVAVYGLYLHYNR